jgi:transposase
MSKEIFTNNGLKFNFEEYEKIFKKNSRTGGLIFKDLKNAIIEYFNCNKSLNEVAKNYNMNGGSLRYNIIRFGLKPRSNSEHKVDKKRVEELCDLYLKGYTNKQLSLIFQISKKTVTEWLKSQNIKPLRLNEKLGITKELKQKAYKLYTEEKLNCCQISKILNVSSRSILDWVKDVKRSQSEIMSKVVFDNGSVNVKSKKGVLNTRFGDIYFNSSYERDRIIQLEKDQNIFDLRRCDDFIEYEINGKTRRYNPDIKITYIQGKEVVEEIKPFCMINKLNNRIKITNAKSFYKKKDIIYKVITEKIIYGK